MPHDPQQVPPIFRIDVSADATTSEPAAGRDVGPMLVTLLRQLLTGQERQNQLLEELSSQLSAAQRQRATELGQWKEANPDLARRCRMAAETLSRVQTTFLQALTEEVADNEECLLDGEFVLNEFVDRFGPRLAHLNGVLQVLSQLSSVTPASNSAQ
ncbi:MAG: hypothetical protein J5I93_27110 [Pirellulaceae bacterium]|nr:hypothetical protein [Pirellulaceae bacterium]